MPGQVVRVVNEGDSDFKDMYANAEYIIPAGTQTMLDYDIICLWLGHPEANNFDPRNRVRVAEYQRLRTRYGVDARSLEMSTAGIPVDDMELFNAMRPKLSVFTLDNKPLITVADDPEGTLLNPQDQSKLSDEGAINARMAYLEQEINNLRSAQAQQQRTEQALNDATPTPHDDLDPEDRPVTSPTGPANIPGTIAVTPAEPEDFNPNAAPRTTPRTEPGEDSPTRVRVSQS